ncbi:MAG: carboxypeptidase-like regulatory domain-containing protein [Candidatus Sericytochromatia bacterium]|nr:carboxypeptidase-like regulatory domain-containing protein [Candidatus Sericytochromatia bacterium]
MRPLPLPLLGLLVSLTGCTPAPCPVASTPATGGVVQGQVRGADGQPVEGATVVAADASGVAIPGTMRARTDQQGTFWAAQLPQGFAYVLVARLPDGKGTVLSTLGRPAEASPPETDITPATTILTLATMRGRAGMPGVFTPEAWALAVQQVEQALAGNPAPDLADPAAVEAWLRQRGEEDATLRANVALLGQELSAGGSREQVETQAGNRQSDPLDALKPIY